MSPIDQLYESSRIFENSTPITNTISTNFNYSIVENMYGQDVLLYTGLIPSTNPLVNSGDGAIYSVDGIDIVEKVDKQVLSSVEGSFFAFSDERLTYIIPNAKFKVVLWSKDSSGEYTVQIPTRFYDIFFYDKIQTYVIYFKEKYAPIYNNATLSNPLYPPAITCYRYCGPKGIENLPNGGGGGSQGAQGSQGPQGQSGIGSQGAQGSQGSQGPQGQTGSGSQGAQGSQGPQGNQGPQGFQGFQGLQGLQGLQGRQGTQGRQGNQGNQGVQGTQGVIGTGTQGTQGPQGASGGGGGSLAGTNYIYVTADGTDTQNATELQAAYDAAKLLSPSATNRITIVAAPGYYNFGSSTFIMDTEYIDLVSLDGNRSVVFNATLNVSARTEGSISIIANDVFVKGVDVLTKNFTIADNLTLLIVENCKGGDFSYGGDPTNGLGTPITLSGTFINCEAGQGSFASYGYASGRFIDCTSGIGSFGSGNGTASGYFERCKGDNGCFGAWGGVSVASGVFIDCEAGNESFGHSYVEEQSLAAGQFIRCRSGDASFGFRGPASGYFESCVAGNSSFGAGNFTALNVASGTFINCRASGQSFGGGTSYPTSVTGEVIYCTIQYNSGGSFGGPRDNGRILLCIDSNGNIVNRKLTAPPVINSITPGNDQATINFTLGNPNGTTISDVEYSIDNGVTYTPSLSITSPIIITNVVNGVSYQVKIKSKTDYGAYSVPSNMVSVVPSTVPDPPTIDSIIPGDTTLEINFTLGSDGSSTITNVQYSTDNGSTFTSMGTTTSPYTITGLTNDVTYDVVVRSVNSNGTSGNSNMVQGTPTA